MTTCADCAHFEACKNIYEIHGDRLSEESYGCDQFSNRSQFVELPKIGNYVYRVYPLDCMGNYGISKMKVKGICISTDRAVFDMELIGKIIFFTKKEAEQASKVLNGREQRNNTD